ncbi:MAG: hypothetical protein Tsb0014_39870 [Pleurocapsa sp.]
MKFDSLESILAKIEQQPGWEQYRQYKQLLECWQKIVNPNTARHTRPLYISRKVLWVATTSSARAQELSFQRYALLKKLNAQLPFKIQDIRFSVAQRQNKSPSQDRQKDTSHSQISFVSQANLTDRLKRKDTSKLETKTQSENLPTARDFTKPQAALQHWLKQNQKRFAATLLCPECASPTPQEELNRWNLCYHCIANKWSAEYRYPGFSDDD